MDNIKSYYLPEISFSPCHPAECDMDQGISGLLAGWLRRGQSLRGMWVFLSDNSFRQDSSSFGSLLGMEREREREEIGFLFHRRDVGVSHVGVTRSIIVQSICG